MSFIIINENNNITIYPPKVDKVIFSDQGTSLLLHFQSDTDKGSDKINNFNLLGKSFLSSINSIV